jgi:DNA modification methylase
MLPVNTIVQGNALDVLRTFPAGCVDLVMTSPPYADSRKHSYGGLRPAQYVDWFLPISHQLYRLLKPDGLSSNLKTGSGLSRRMASCLGRDRVYPDNVLHLATECHNRQHSAAYPIELPAWFIKLLTQEGDLVLDPFMGSGSTAVAAVKLNRRYLGVELNPMFVKVAKDRLTNGLGDERVAA